MYFQYLIIIFFLFTTNTVIGQRTSKIIESKINCEIEKQSRIEIRAGVNEKFIQSPIVSEYSTPLGFSPSVHLTIPVKIRDSYFFTKLIFGGSINNVVFKDISPGFIDRVPTFASGTIYSNVYTGIGFGKHIIKPLKNKAFLSIPISLNCIYFPYVEVSGNEGFQPLPNIDYQFDVIANYADKTNFSLVPEIAVDYHFILNGCKSYSIGLYYSRGINVAHEGSIAIKKVNGEEFSQSFKKSFNTFGISFGYGIFKSKN